MTDRYKSAIDEFNYETEDGKARLVYAYFGLAIYHGQCLEEALSQMLWTNKIFSQKPQTNLEVNEIIDAIEKSKKTMGNFIHEVMQIYNLDNKIINQLRAILDRRNYLVHKYFKLHIEKFCSHLGCLEMIEYFCNFIDDSKNLDDELKIYYSHYANKLGLTKQRIAELVEELKNQELKRAGEK